MSLIKENKTEPKQNKIKKKKKNTKRKKKKRRVGIRCGRGNEVTFINQN